MTVESILTNLYKYGVYHILIRTGSQLQLQTHDPPASASQVAGITGIHYCAWLRSFLKS